MGIQACFSVSRDDKGSRGACGLPVNIEKVGLQWVRLDVGLLELARSGDYFLERLIRAFALALILFLGTVISGERIMLTVVNMQPSIEDSPQIERLRIREFQSPRVSRLTCYGSRWIHLSKLRVWIQNCTSWWTSVHQA